MVVIYIYIYINIIYQCHINRQYTFISYGKLINSMLFKSIIIIVIIYKYETHTHTHTHKCKVKHIHICTAKGHLFISMNSVT